MDAQFLTEISRFGFGQSAETSLGVIRASLGTFFAISGWHKLTVPERHAALVQTLREDRIPMIRQMEWFVPAVELGAGTALAIGFYSGASAALLLAICVVATCADGIRHIKERFNPINRADLLDDILYLPEVLYSMMLLAIIEAGPGRFAFDNLLR